MSSNQFKLQQHTGTPENGHNSQTLPRLPIRNVAAYARGDLFAYEIRPQDIHRPESVFDPTDEWATQFRRGLRKLPDLSGKRIVEVGVGAGMNVVDLLRSWPQIEVIYGTDLDAHAVEVAESNVRKFTGELAGKFIPMHGSHNLLTEFKHPVDLVVCCIPQVKLPHGGSDLQDTVAHYYSPELVPLQVEVLDHFDHYSLGLNAALLAQASMILEPHKGSVVLNLAGRPPEPVLNGLFETYGFEPYVIHESVIAQHKGTSIDQMVEDERKFGIRFEFFLNSEPGDSSQPVSASAARAHLESGGKIYHKLLVVEGILRDSVDTAPNANHE